MLDWTAAEALRILCALWFVPHIAGKAMHYAKAAGTFEAAGIRPGLVFVGVTIAVETLAVLGLLFGIFPQFAGVLAAAVLFGAAYAVVRINGFNWRWQKMGPEYPIFWGLVCLSAGFM